MVGTNIFVLAAVLAVLLCVSNVDASFKCYECVGLSDSDSCSDEFTKSSKFESTATCQGCVKTKINGVVIRACSIIPLGNTCEESNGNSACICDTELCNGSNILTVSMATLLSTSLAVFLSKF